MPYYQVSPFGTIRNDLRVDQQKMMTLHNHPPLPTNMHPATKRKSLGQYFTTSAALQDWIYEKVQYKGQPLLEPSVGAGHLLQPFLRVNPAYPIISYEIDGSIARLPLRPMEDWVVGDFLTAEITDRFPTIIGNPPYVKRSHKPNLYLDFITRCLDLLTPNGELLMIVPSDFLKLTSAAPLLKRMVAGGAFTDVWFPHDEGLFAGAAIDVVLFRYQQGLAQTMVLVNDVPKSLRCSEGIVTFVGTDVSAASQTIGDLFDVYVGIVSGADGVYRSTIGDTPILTDKDRVSTFILPRVWPTGSAAIDARLLEHKAVLLGRKIRRFDESNWWQWGALRNLEAVVAATGRPCLYVRMMTRSTEVAFPGTVQLFGGGLLCLIPKATAPADAIAKALIAIQDVRNDYVYAGRFKMGHKQVRQILL
jgi:adenine-specific DNA-methyltransferase